MVDGTASGCPVPGILRRRFHRDIFSVTDGKSTGGATGRRQGKTRLAPWLERRYLQKDNTKSRLIGREEVCGANLGCLSQKCRSLLYGPPTRTVTRIHAPSKHFIDFRLSDFPPRSCVGPLWIQNQFNYLLILAKQTLEGQEVRVCASQGLMRSAHHARDRSLISHNLSDVAARTNRDSRGGAKGLRTRFICRDVWEENFLLRPNVPFFDLRTPWHSGSSCSSSTFRYLPIQWNVPFLIITLLCSPHRM